MPRIQSQTPATKRLLALRNPLSVFRADFWTSRRMAGFWTSRRMADFWACRRAVAAVEFAIIVPVMLAALTGLVGYGLIIYQDMQLTTAAQAAGQLAIIDSSSETAIKTAAVDATDLPITADNVTITTFCECANGSAATCGGTCATDGRTARYLMTINVAMSAEILFYGGTVDLSQSVTVRTQ